jgi:NhaP-type Na+/H+ or K+/H+ antiporter
VPAGLLVGYLMGTLVGRLAIWLRTREPDNHAPNDLLLLALICTSYFAAERLGAWGFLAVFTAGLGLRRAEVSAVRASPHPKASEGRTQTSGAVQQVPAEHLVEANVEPQSLETPAVSAGVLVAESLTFGQALERMVEFFLVVVVGAALATHWDARGALLAGLLMLVIRPFSVLLCLPGTPTTAVQRSLLGWFGIRGIGSLYYLSYALTHGFAGEQARTVTDWVVSVVAASILVHGITAAPLTRLYERHMEASSRLQHPASAEAGRR